MKVTEHIQKENGKTQFSFEVLPPLKGKILKNIRLYRNQTNVEVFC